MTPCAVLSPRFPGRKLRKDCLQGQAAASRAWCYTVTIVLPPDLCKEALASTDNPLEVVARGRSLWLLGSRAQAQKLQLEGLVTLQYVGSSRTRDQTCISCIDRWILNQLATRAVCA